MLKAIETTGRVNKRRKLDLSGKLPFKENTTVRVIILSEENDEINDNEWLHTASTNSAFSYLDDPIEDIYSIDDGKAFNDKE